jgi:hypothetical protein
VNSHINGISGFLDFIHRPVFQRTHDVSESGSVFVLRCKKGGKTPTQLGPLERANLNRPVRTEPDPDHSKVKRE